MAVGRALIGGLAGVLLLGGFLLYAVMIYNGLVRLRRNIDEAWSNIDVLLKQRSDEIPKLIDTAEEYMDYEKDVLQDITEARTKVQQSNNPEDAAKANEMLRFAHCWTREA